MKSMTSCKSEEDLLGKLIAEIKSEEKLEKGKEK